jgi:Mn-dependent DtxR family transcriptional regulator
MQIHQSAEDYLEAILILKNRKGAVRSIDIATYKGYSKPSISRAVSLLRENGYILVDKDGFISLTESGMEIASKIYERHELIRNWLIRIGVPAEVAAEDACKMEHDLSSETFERMKEFVLRTMGGEINGEV